MTTTYRPDVALLRPRADFYGGSTAAPSDVLLLLEVADSTLRTDLGRKARMYCGRGCGGLGHRPEQPRAVHASCASHGRYTTRRVVAAVERIDAEFAPEVTFAASELIG